MSSILLTGAAGFIGSHVAERLLSLGYTVTALDNFDSFYEPAIKRSNIWRCLGNPAYTLKEVDIRNQRQLEAAVPNGVDAVIHLAARAGVRPSIDNPLLYQDVNVRGTHNMLELCRSRSIKHFIFASSSSVYGVNSDLPWKENSSSLLPISPYASTKISGELLGHVYSRLFGIRFMALRFFTVYGPRQRPDLAIHSFARAILRDDPIRLFGNVAVGKSTYRDYTYIDDIVRAVIAALDYRDTMYEVINVGNDRPVSLVKLVNTLEKVLGKQARIEWLSAQPGDVPSTWANINKARTLLNYSPSTDLVTGLRHFASWLSEYPSNLSTPTPLASQGGALLATPQGV